MLGRIDPVAFRAAFTAWATAALPDLAGEQVCVDGKAVRGSRDGAKPAVHPVSAFAGRARWVLARQAVAEKPDEITAIPDLPGLPDLRGAVVSIDAMGCQKAIARTIIEGGADYVLALKDNQPTSREDVRLWLDTEVARGHLTVLETVEKDHGRIEIRRYALSDRIDWFGGQTGLGRAPGDRPGRVHPHHRGENQRRLPLLPVLVGGARPVCGHGATALEHRKSTALGLGRAIRGRCLPDPQGPLGGKSGPDPPHRPQRAAPQRPPA